MNAKPKRECGTCNICCIVPTIDVLNKPRGTPCRHLRPGAAPCSIYPERPECCAVYKCAWLDGTLPDSLKPDACGMLGESAELHHRSGHKLTLVLMTEYVPGSAARYDAEMAGVVKGRDGIAILAPPVVHVGTPLAGRVVEAFLRETQEAGKLNLDLGDGSFEMDLATGETRDRAPAEKNS